METWGESAKFYVVFQLFSSFFISLFLPSFLTSHLFRKHLNQIWRFGVLTEKLHHVSVIFKSDAAKYWLSAACNQSQAGPLSFGCFCNFKCDDSGSQVCREGLSGFLLVFQSAAGVLNKEKNKGETASLTLSHLRARAAAALI